MIAACHAGALEIACHHLFRQQFFFNPTDVGAGYTATGELWMFTHVMCESEENPAISLMYASIYPAY